MLSAAAATLIYNNEEPTEKKGCCLDNSQLTSLTTPLFRLSHFSGWASGRRLRLYHVVVPLSLGPGLPLFTIDSSHPRESLQLTISTHRRTNDSVEFRQLFSSLFLAFSILGQNGPSEKNGWIMQPTANGFRAQPDRWTWLTKPCDPLLYQVQSIHPYICYIALDPVETAAMFR
jgi:hypothetical protein